jgi:predicted  nucleic acid-binding Zn-ribbon protein
MYPKEIKSLDKEIKWEARIMISLDKEIKPLDKEIKPLDKEIKLEARKMNS